MSGSDVNAKSGSITRVEFSFDDAPYPFVSVSGELGCEFELAEMIPHRDGSYAEFFNVTGTDPERIADRYRAHDVVDVTLLSEYERGGLFEFVVSEQCPAAALANWGALPREVRGVDGEGHIAAEIPPRYDTTDIIESFLDEHPEGELACKQGDESFTPIFTDSTVEHVLHTHLTDRQREVLRAAFDGGYYDWPRDCTGEDIAAELEISSATFSEHIHAAERKLLAAMFEET